MRAIGRACWHNAISGPKKVSMFRALPMALVMDLLAV